MSQSGKLTWIYIQTCIFHKIKNLVRCLYMVYVCLSPSTLLVPQGFLLSLVAHHAWHIIDNPQIFITFKFSFDSDPHSLHGVETI